MTWAGNSGWTHSDSRAHSKNLAANSRESYLLDRIMRLKPWALAGISALEVCVRSKNQQPSNSRSPRSSRAPRPQINTEFDFESSEGGGIDPRLTIDGPTDDRTADTGTSGDLADAVLVGEGPQFEGEESSDLGHGVGTDLVGPVTTETARRGSHRTGHDPSIRLIEEPTLLSTNTDVTDQTYGVLSKQQQVRLGAIVAEYYQTFRPLIPATHWEAIGDFVRACMFDTDRVSINTATGSIGAVTRFVQWAWQRGYELDRSAIFNRFVIEEFIAVGYPPNWSEGTRRNARTRLFGVSHALLGADAFIPRMNSLPGDHPSEPYDANGIAALRSWASGQGTPRRRRDASVLLSTGIGAGLKVEDLFPMRRRDIAQIDGYVILNVAGRHPRQVPLLAEWEDLLLETVSSLSPDAFIFSEGRRPEGARSKNSVNAFLNAASGVLRPNSQRMRATWLVHHMTIATPIKLLLKAGGITSAHALVRFMPFVPEVDEDEARRLLRGE